MTRGSDLSAPIAEWIAVLGNDSVLIDSRSIAPYALDTTTLRRDIPVVLKPVNSDEVVALVRIANKYAVPIYPISTGHNWGYGTASPVVDGCVLVDLSGMKQIFDVQPETGLVTVEPGVTQQQLRDWLDERGLRFLVPVTGAGPNCSLLGNALERGYGITPHADHFGALTWLEAVLPDGSVYRGAMSSLGSEELDKSFRYGIGPYLDGLFSQGAFGIVTQACILLAPIPARTEAFFFSLERDEDLESAVDAVREVLRVVGGLGGSINLMNDRRVLAMTEGYAREAVPRGDVMPASMVHDRARQFQILPWTGLGALYGEHVMVAAAKRLVKQRLRGRVKRLFFLTPSLAQRANFLMRFFPARGGRIGKVAEKLHSTLQLLAGQPSEIALPLAYWQSGRIPVGGQMDPARDGCGLIWYSPLVLMSSRRVRAYVDMVQRICINHGIEPLITLTSISPHCFDSTVPILFDRQDTDATVRADACYRALFEAGRKEGYLPYRMGAQYMDLVTKVDCDFWRLVTRIKHAVDPNNIIAPGRYCP